MKVFKLGEAQLAACDTCKCFNNSTFKIRNVPLSDGSGIVNRILVGVCDICGSVTLLPHNQVSLVKKQLESQKNNI
jgi:hypothetical protein